MDEKKNSNLNAVAYIWLLFGAILIVVSIFFSGIHNLVLAAGNVFIGLYFVMIASINKDLSMKKSFVFFGACYFLIAIIYTLMHYNQSAILMGLSFGVFMSFILYGSICFLFLEKEIEQDIDRLERIHKLVMEYKKNDR